MSEGADPAKKEENPFFVQQTPVDDREPLAPNPLSEAALRLNILDDQARREAELRQKQEESAIQWRYDTQYKEAQYRRASIKTMALFSLFGGLAAAGVFGWWSSRSKRIEAEYES